MRPAPYPEMSLGSRASRHASIASPPTPHVVTLLTTVPSSGLRARMMGSNAGLSDVPSPRKRSAHSLVGRPHRPQIWLPCTDPSLRLSIPLRLG